MMRFLRNMQVWKKITLIIALMAIPLAIAISGFVNKANEDMTFNEMERVGVRYIEALRPLLELVPQHRETAQAIRYGSVDRTALFEQLTLDIDDAMNALETRDIEHGDRLGISGSIARLKASWLELKRRTNDNAFVHGLLMDDLIALIKQVGDASNLTIDPELSTFYLMMLTVTDLPETVEDLARLRTVVTEHAYLKRISTKERETLTKRLGSYEWAARAINRDVRLAIKANLLFDPIISPLTASAAEAENALLGFLQATATEGNIDFPADQAAELFNAAIQGHLKVYDASLTELNRQLAARSEALLSQTYQTLALLVPGLLLVFFVCFLISRSITRPLGEALRASRAISHGDLSVKIGSRSEDEVGLLMASMADMTAYLQEMASVAETIAGGNLQVRVEPRSSRDTFGISFKNMCSSTQLLGRSREEHDRLQHDIMKLLEEISGVGQGDLTSEAEVTAGSMGAVADSFNFMIGELRKVINNVKGSAQKVKGSAQSIQATTEQLAQGTTVQARQIADITASVKDMADSIQQVSEHATVSATVAEQSRANAKQGTKAVQNNINGMQLIREQVQETAKRIKRLGERSQEIGEIIQLIEDIADRTSMLALNASIQAAMAGEAGRGFAVVAEEVERLADRSTNSTKQIAALIKSIQAETNDAVAAMEETTRDVVEGSNLAAEAGQTLSEIEAVSNRLADLIQAISTAALQQARGSEAVTNTMQEILTVTRAIETGTSDAAASVGSLVSLADTLNGSVATFRLPNEDNGQTYAIN